MIEKDNLKNKTLTGLLWSFIDLFASQGIQLLVLLYLARVLVPEHFGLIGMVAVFIAISHTIVDSGFSQALIREEKVDKEEYSTIFYFNLMIAGSLYLLLYLLAPLISNFFANEELKGIMRVLSLGIIINSLGIIPRVLLIKKINFKTQSIITILSSSLAGGVAIILAVSGFGVWSLVIQSLTNQLLQTCFLWWMNRWFPAFAFRIAFFRKLFGFGSKLLISGLIDTFFNHIYSIIIGRFYSAAQLGYYANAVKLTDVITNSSTAALQRVTYPVLSAIREDKVRLKRMYQKIMRLTAYLMFPIMMGLIAIADSLIPLLLGDAWVESIAYFQLLCMAAMIYPLHAINLNILQVQGRADLFLKLEIIKKTLLTFLIGTSLFFELGITGLIGAAILCSYISLFINSFYSAKEISYSIFQQLKDIYPSFILSISMGITVYSLGIALPISYFFKIIIQVSTGVVFYMLISKVFKFKEFHMILEMLFQNVLKINKGKLRGSA